MDEAKNTPTKDSWRLVAQLFETDAVAERMERDALVATKSFLQCIMEVTGVDDDHKNVQDRT